MVKVVHALLFSVAFIHSAVVAAQNGSVSGGIYGITVAEGAVIEMSADDVAILGQSGITEFRKDGLGVLKVRSIPNFAGTIRIVSGTYSVNGQVVSPFGSTVGPTIVEDGATLLFCGVSGSSTRYSEDFATEEFRLAGRGVDGSGAICIAAENESANNRVFFGKMTLLGDTLITGPKIGAKSTNYPFFWNGYDFDMNGHTLELNCTANAELRCSNIVNPGHIVTRGSGQLVVGAAAQFNHGSRSTLTIASSAQFIFYDNELRNPFNWKIICQSETSTIGFNKSATLDSDIEIAGGCQCIVSAGANEVRLAGSITGAGALKLNGTKIFLGGDNSCAGSISGGTVYVGSPTAIPDYAKCTSTIAGFVFSSAGNGFGIKSTEVAALVSGPAHDLLVGGTEKTFSVPDGGVVEFNADISDWGGNFRNDSNGTIVFTKAINTMRSISFTHTGSSGGFRFANPEGDVSNVGQLILRGRMEWFDASLFKSNNTVYCNGTIANPSHLVISNSFVWGEHFNDSTKKLGPFRMGDARGIDILEVREGSIVSNSLIAGTQAESISAIYHRGGDFAVLKNYNSDSAIGELGFGYLEMSGGHGSIVEHCHLGHRPGAIGIHYISGGNLSVPKASYNIGQSGHAVYYQTAGSVSFGTMLNIGSSAYDARCTEPAAQGVRHAFTVEGERSSVVVNGSIKMSERNNTEDTINLNDGGKLMAATIFRSRAEKDNNGTCLPEGGFYENDNAYVNFNGGILRAGGNVFGDSNAKFDGRGTTSRCPKVVVYPKGATIELSSRAFVKAPIEAPKGQGVISVAMPDTVVATGLSVPPYVQIVGDGSNATAVAVYDSLQRKWTGIRVTSPGFGYTWAKAVIRTERYGEDHEADCTLGDVSGGGVHFKLDYLVSSGYAQCEINSTCTYTGPTRISGGRVWFNGGAIASRDIQIDADANLVMDSCINGANVHGSGETVGNWTTSQFTADAHERGIQQTYQNLTVGENPVIALKNLTGCDQRITVLRAPAAGAKIIGMENFRSATFAGDELPAKFAARVDFVNGEVVVKVYKEKGLTFVFR